MRLNCRQRDIFSLDAFFSLEFVSFSLEFVFFSLEFVFLFFSLDAFFSLEFVFFSLELIFSSFSLQSFYPDIQMKTPPDLVGLPNIFGSPSCCCSHLKSDFSSKLFPFIFKVYPDCDTVISKMNIFPLIARNTIAVLVSLIQSMLSSYLPFKRLNI